MSATISMTYDVNNAAATNMLRMLFASGLFQLKEDREWSKEEEKEAFLCTSRFNSGLLLWMKWSHIHLTNQVM